MFINTSPSRDIHFDIMHNIPAYPENIFVGIPRPVLIVLLIPTI